MQRSWMVESLLLGALLAMPASAQDAETRGRQVIDEAVAALGGDAFLNVRNRVQEGRVYSFRYGELRGVARATTYTRYVPVEPSDTATKLGVQVHQGYGEDHYYYEVVREEGAWEVTYRGPEMLEPDVLVQFRDRQMHDFFYIMRLRRDEPGLVFESRGTRVIDNMPTNIVDIIDAENRVVTVYFHQSTKLPVRQDWQWRDPVTRRRNDEVTRFSLYRQVDGMQWPFQIHRETNGSKSYESYAETVLVNQEIEERRFAIPTDQSRPIKR